MTLKDARLIAVGKGVAPFHNDPRRACGDTTNLNLFFPEHSRGRNTGDIAKQICERCVFREACAEWAIAVNETHGIWGGLNPHERDRIRKKRVKDARAVNRRPAEASLGSDPVPDVA